MRKILSLLLSLVMVLSMLTPIAFAEDTASYPEGTIIIPLGDDGRPTAASGTGWTYSDDTLTLNEGKFAVNGSCTAEVYNRAVIVGGTYDGKVYNRDRDDAKTAVCGTIDGGTFNNDVESRHPWVNCTINAGIFNGKVTVGNHSFVHGGTFNGEFKKFLGCTITGGTFPISYETNGGSWTKGYTAPTAYSYSTSLGIALPDADNISNGDSLFAGWYDNEDFEGNALTHIPAKTAGKLTLYAKFISTTATWELISTSAREDVDYAKDADGNYTVYTAKGLAKIAAIVNDGDDLFGKTVTLANDIDLLSGGVDGYGAGTVTETNSWEPIYDFSGTFDGKGHKISNLFIAATDKNVGLFGFNAGTIKNLEIESGRITAEISSDWSRYAGGIAASTSGLIDNCVNRAEVFVKVTAYSSYGCYIGGITGLHSTDALSNGMNISKVSNCVNYGTISANGAAYCGGIAGYQFSGRNVVNGVPRKTLIEKCTNEGSVSAGGSGWGGGIAGSVQSNSASDTSITATIANCCNKGLISGRDVGGISGLNQNRVYIYNCYNFGGLNGTVNAGGIVGITQYDSPVISNCYNTGTIAINQTANIGGIAGNLLTGEVSNCYYLMSTGLAAFGQEGTAATVQDCLAFNSVSGSHTLDGTVYGTSDLLTALNAWVADHNSNSAYLNWRADTQNSNYPVFAKASVVTFDANGGDVTPASGTTDTINFTLSFLPTPTRSGYTFKGWFTAAVGGDEVTTRTVFPSDTTIFAHWEQKKGGGGGSHTSTYPIVVEDSRNGEVTADRKSAAAGTTVTITVTPDNGYTLSTLVVNGQNGQTPKLTHKEDGKYTFTMPACGVTVKASFTLADSKCDGSGEYCPSARFLDIDTSKWYHEALDYVISRKLMNGYGERLFGPDDDTTRAQFAAILWNLNGQPASDSPLDFTDVTEGAWYTEPLRWAVGADVVLGYGNGMVGPNDPITREQLAAMLYRYAQSQGSGFTCQWAFRMNYADIDEISSWAWEAVCWCNMNGILNGDDTKHLNPAQHASRAHIAQMMMNYLRNNK